MADRISPADVRTAWVNFVDAAKGAGLDVNGWQMTEGTPSMGISYSARKADGSPVPGTISVGFDNARLGMTRAETYNALRHATSAMNAVAALHH